MKPISRYGNTPVTITVQKVKKGAHTALRGL